MERSLDIFLDKLTARTRLTEEERRAVLALPGRSERLEAHKPFVLFGDAATTATLVIDGFCARVEAPSDDKRQITAIYVQGDMPDLYSAFQPEAVANLETLTQATIARISHADIREVMRRFPAVAEAFCRYLVADAVITAEWLVNVGSRDARAALAHLFCEMAVRMGKVVANNFSFHFPVSQLQLSEATGLSAVHVNRSLGSLRHDGLMRVERGAVQVPDWKGLVQAAQFNERYLMAPATRRYAI